MLGAFLVLLALTGCLGVPDEVVEMDRNLQESADDPAPGLLPRSGFMNPALPPEGGEDY